MSDFVPLELPGGTIEVETLNVCAVCREPAEHSYDVDGVRVKLCEKHAAARRDPPPTPRHKASPDQLSLF